MPPVRSKKNLQPPPSLITDDAVANQWFYDVSSRAQLFSGKTAPDPNQGHAGDWYADTVAKHIYVKVMTVTAKTSPETHIVTNLWTLIV